MAAFIIALAVPSAYLPAYAVLATSMDINEFESEMAVGATQTISVVLYPDEADDVINYSSSKPTVATISPSGKIEALSAGTTNITASAGSISKTLSLTVSAITMDINDFEKKMTVGSSQTISVTLYPSSAKEEIKYSSSNTAVATISPGGKIEAKSAGTTKITVSAGGAKKTLKLTVSVGTDGISLNSTYLTMRRGESFKIKAKISPENAARKLTYKSNDRSIAKVSKKGVITAVGVGSTSIIVSNGDLSAGIDVIVNSSSSGGGSMQFSSDDEALADEADDESAGSTSGSIDADTLKSLQKTGKSLTIEKGDYSLVIDGAYILNSDKAIDDELHIVKNEDGYTFAVGSDGFLPGEISIKFSNQEMRGCKYVYLLDKSTDKYQMFGELTDGEFRTDIAGSYRITYEKLKLGGVNKLVVAIAAAALLAIAVAYCLIRRFL
ncbi:MAG: Ig-like domain-containing protein [Mogibacterium sp.]|nr:Ig-like domain-containing protein [Mogibacterium sp.]